MQELKDDQRIIKSRIGAAEDELTILRDDLARTNMLIRREERDNRIEVGK